MLGIRTPAKGSSDIDPRSSPINEDKENQSNEPNVRLIIGKWEMGKIDHLPNSPVSPPQAGPVKSKQKAITLQEKPRRRPSVEAPEKTTQKSTSSRDRVAEARICLQKAKTNLGDARNLKGDIKVEVTRALDRLYLLVKEAEAERKDGRGKEAGKEVGNTEVPVEKKIEEGNILRKIEGNRRLLLENQKKMDEIKEEMEIYRTNQEKATYANITAGAVDQQRRPPRTALHSIIISSKDEQETGEEVLKKVRDAVNAKEGWVKVEKIRKARDRKIIMGCSTEEERDKVRARIEKAKHLTVEEVKNKDPLLTLKDVLLLNSDEEVIKAIRNQNKEVFHGLRKDEDRLVIKYKRKTRNPHTNHIIMSVSPAIWKRTLEAGAVRIDLQRVKVADQSPLVQCTRCLAYGHGKRFCKELADACSHCGEQHLSIECPGRLAGETPMCRNCVRARNDNTQHNAFSQECPVRRRWDEIARSTIAYC